MTPRARITAAFEHREPDRTPVFEYVLLSPLADQILRRPYAPCNWDHLVAEKGWEKTVRQEAVDRLEIALTLGHDMMYVWPNRLPPADPPQVAPAQPGLEDPVEILRRRCELAEQNFRPPAEESFRVYVFLREEMRRRGVDLPILAPAWSHGVWTDTALMMTMVLEPELARRHFALATRASLASVKRYLDLGIEIIGVGGDFAGNRPLISPEAYRRFIMPEVRKVSGAIHAGGRWSVNASDGDLWSVIDDFLIGCDVDGYCEIDYHAGMDLGALKARFGGRITFLGNLDCGNILSFGSSADIRRHVRECLRKGTGNGGHILCVSNAITESVPLDNYLTVVDAYRDYFDLPPILQDRSRCGRETPAFGRKSILVEREAVLLSDQDLRWLNGFLDDLLERWRRGSDNPNGLFHPYLDREWHRREGGPYTLVSQCRLIYVFTRAFERSGSEAYASAAQRGVEALIQYFGSPDGNGYRWACDAGGAGCDETLDAYGHAFVILALATAAAAFRNERYRDLAVRAWHFMQRHLTDSCGGLIWHMDRSGRPTEDVRSQNPLMHTFEALLALAPLDETGAIRKDAARVRQFIASRMIAPGRLPEWYDAHWQPMTEGDRSGIDVGHALEWAFLLSEWHALCGDDEPLTSARQFLSFGIHYGYDAKEGGIYSFTDLEGRIRNSDKGWWQQCEAIRAIHRFARRHSAAELETPLRQSIEFVRRHFVDAEHGGWFLNPPGLGGSVSLDKGNAWKLDYHVVNMCLELLR